ncbi:MAG: enoyl-ACP reductase [Gammaproteobacteria bacterium]
MGFLTGKRALIVGVASERSIAWGIAKAMAAQGASLAFTYQNEKLGERVHKLAATLDEQPVCLQMDVADDAQIEQCFAQLESRDLPLDTVVHAVGFAPRDQLSGGFTDSVTREGFGIAHDISAYSFCALAKAARPALAARNGNLLTLSYLGAVKAVPNYNVMGLAKASLEASVRFLAADLGAEGIRVNGISAGPIRTLAASGIGGFRKMLNHVAEAAPLKRNVTADDVGHAAAFLSSDLAAGITGEILYVDGGYSNVAMTLGD